MTSVRFPVPQSSAPGNAAPSPWEQTPVEQDDDLDLGAYLASMTHVSLIQDNELIPCDYFNQQSGSILSVGDDLEDW